MITTEDLRRWAVETAIRAGSSYDALAFAQRLVDFVAPPGDGPAPVPADFGKRDAGAAGVTIGSGMGQPLDMEALFERESCREVSRDAIAERKAIIDWLAGQSQHWCACQIRRGMHHG